MMMITMMITMEMFRTAAAGTTLYFVFSIFSLYSDFSGMIIHPSTDDRQTTVVGVIDDFRFRFRLMMIDDVCLLSVCCFYQRLLFTGKVT